MDPVNYTIGNPVTLLIERGFWLALGGFLGAAIFLSIIRRDIDHKHNKSIASELEDLAEKAIEQNE